MISRGLLSSKNQLLNKIAKYSNINQILAKNYSANAPYEVFDREAKKFQRDWAASKTELSRQTDYLRDEVAQTLIDRLLLIKRKYSTVVDLGAGSGHIAKFMDPTITQKVISCELSPKLLHRDEDQPYEIEVERMVVDEEILPFQENSLDIIMSSMALHWVNDLPGTLIQIKNSLKPDGVFLGAMIGGDSLFELRTSLQLAELERGGGMSPRVSPFAESRDVVNLMNRAGFALSTVDVDEIVINYPSMFELIDDLQLMGESNSVIARHPYIKRDTLMAAASIYQAAHGNEDGTVPATFQIVHMIGWKPDPSQPKPLAPGSAKSSLKDAIE